MPFGSGLISKVAPGKGLDLYSNAYVFVNGSLLAQEASVTISKKSNSKPIVTFHKGWAGISLGACVTDITVENAVPSADFEFYPDFYLKTGLPLDFGVAMASRTCQLRGVIDEVNYTHAVDESAKLSFHIIGRFEAFE